MCPSFWYNQDEYCDFYHGFDFPKMKHISENVNEFIGDVIELNLCKIKPDKIPQHINIHVEKFTPSGKRN